MGNKGTLSLKREKQLAKIFDGLIDYRKVCGDKKILWGLINVGNILEKRDYDIYLALIQLLDDGILADKINEKAKNTFDTAITYLEERNVEGFNAYVAKILDDKIDIGLGDYEETLFKSVLGALNALFQIVFDKVDKAIIKYEEENPEKDKNE